jgi:hypothetical protein
VVNEAVAVDTVGQAIVVIVLNVVNVVNAVNEAAAAEDVETVIVLEDVEGERTGEGGEDEVQVLAAAAVVVVRRLLMLPTPTHSLHLLREWS